MTTTHASTAAAPKPVENKPAQTNARQSAEKPGEADLFASLLSLVSDTHTAAATTPLETEAATTADGETAADDKTENPLAALLAWVTPPATPAAAAPTDPAAATVAASGAKPTPDATAPLATDGAVRETGVDIEGMTRVDEAAPAPTAAALARAAAASRPAFSPVNPTATSATQRTDSTSGLHAGTAAPAMIWQRGATTVTEALQQQHHTQIAQMRSTVALNERFGPAGAPELAGTALREFTTTTPTTGSGGTSGPTLALDGSQAVNGAAASGETGSGDPSRDGQTDATPGDAQAHAEASAEADSQTVSHWGTQHLRHASLRVGGEGGADAIDIQLAVKGQEVQVAFQTDNAEARASLRENAGASLADLMQRSGIQLGGVSVGSQGQAQGDGANHAREASPRTVGLGRAAAASEPASCPVPLPRTDGSRPLDVFA